MTVYETHASEHHDARLPDGSQLSLGAKSLVWIRYGDQERTVTLERGEAFFEVAKDEERPFVVRAGDATITAVGTAFNVRKTGERVLVAVSEGVVRVKPSAPDRGPVDPRTASQASVPPVPEQRVAAGEQITLGGMQTASKVRSVDAEATAAWRGGRLEYLGEPLKYVLADVNRYSAEAISLGDPEAGELLVTGTVYESDVSAWLDSLEEILPVTVQKRGGERVVLTRRWE
jgi:transmembrane sensor